jgi:hypothetical protein
MMMHGANMGSIRGGPMTAAPMSGRVQGWGGRTAWGRDHFHDHFHHRFHNRNFFVFGFGGYDYAYNSCWSWVPTRFGWQWVNVCGDYYWNRCEVEERKRPLAKLLRGSHLSIVLNETFEEDGAIVYRACRLGCEGIVSKRLGSRYRSGRSPLWLKVKNPNAPAVKREAEEDWGK